MPRGYGVAVKVAAPQTYTKSGYATCDPDGYAYLLPILGPTFPSTGTIDSGSRTVPENPISNSGVWAADAGIETTWSAQLALVGSVNLICSDGHDNWFSPYVASAKGPDCEVYAQVDPTPTDLWTYGLFIRFAQPGATTADGYYIEFQEA